MFCYFATKGRFRWLIQLKTLAGAFKQDVKSRISLRDFHHGLLNKRFRSRELAAVSTMQIIDQIQNDEDTSWRRIDGHVVCHIVVEELRTRITFNVVGIIIGTTQLDINPIFLSGVIVHDIPRVGQITGKAWLRNIPLRTEK